MNGRSMAIRLSCRAGTVRPTRNCGIPAIRRARTYGQGRSRIVSDSMMGRRRMRERSCVEHVKRAVYLRRSATRCSSTGRMLRKSANGVLASFRPSMSRKSSSEVGSTGGDFPFAKIYSNGERPTRSAVCTSSVRHSLRPSGTAFLSILLSH